MVRALVVFTVGAVMFAVVPLVLLPPVDDLWREECLVHRVAQRIQLEAVDKQAVMGREVVDGEGQLEMARAIDLELDVLAMFALHRDGAAWAFDVDELAIGNLRADALDGVGNLDIGVADLGRDEESSGSWDGQEACRNREGLQQHGADVLNNHLSVGSKESR